MKLYRRLVKLLCPESFRDKYQELTEQAFRDQWRESKHPFEFWLRTLLDIVRSAPSLHLLDHLQTFAPII